MAILTILLCSPLTIKYENISKKVVPLFIFLFCLFCLFFYSFLYLLYFYFVRIFLLLLITSCSNMMNIVSEAFVILSLIEVFATLCCNFMTNYFYFILMNTILLFYDTSSLLPDYSLPHNSYEWREWRVWTCEGNVLRNRSQHWEKIRDE